MRLITYPTISDVMATEDLGKRLNWKGEVTYLPGFLKAGCGLAYKIENNDIDLKKELEENNIKYTQIYDMIEKDNNPELI